MFTELYGSKWEVFDELMFDPEEMPTTHDYERYYPEGSLDHVDHRGEHFQRKLKKEILMRKSTYQQHKENQEHFKLMMHMFAHLNEKEGRDLLHMIRNNNK